MRRVLKDGLSIHNTVAVPLDQNPVAASELALIRWRSVSAFNEAIEAAKHPFQEEVIIIDFMLERKKRRGG